MHLSHFLWSNDPGAVLVLLPLYTAQLQMPKILKTWIREGYVQDLVKLQNVSKVSEVIIPQIFCSVFNGIMEDTEIEVGCLSFPRLIPYCSFPTERSQTWSLDFNHLVLGYAPHLDFLVSIQFWQGTQVSLCVSFCKTFIQLPLLAQQRASSTTCSSGAKGSPKLPLRKELFLPWNLAMILKLVSYSEVIEQSGCSLYSSMKSLPRVILSAVLQVRRSYIPFKRHKEKDSLKRFLIPLILLGSSFIPYFTVFQAASSCIAICFSVALKSFSVQSFSVLQLSTRMRVSPQAMGSGGSINMHAWCKAETYFCWRRIRSWGQTFYTWARFW